MVYKKVLESELDFLQSEMTELKGKLLTLRDEDEQYLKALRCYLAVQKRYLEIQGQIATAEGAKDDPLLSFNAAS